MEKLTIETGALQDWIKQSEQSKTPMGLATMNSELRDAEKAYKDAKAKQEKGEYVKVMFDKPVLKQYRRDTGVEDSISAAGVKLVAGKQ